MALSAGLKHALRISLGDNCGSELIRVLEAHSLAFVETKKPIFLAPIAEPSATVPAPAVEPVPAEPVVTVPPAEEDASHLDGPA